LVLGVAWTGAVTTAQPNWYDPGESCTAKVGENLEPGHSLQVLTSWFPPSASCDYGGGDNRQYMSTTTSVVLSIVGLLILILIATTLTLTIRRIRNQPNETRPATHDLRKRKRNQLTFGVLDVALATAVLTFLNATAIVFGGLPGGPLFALAAIAGLTSLGIALDSHLGPLPSTTLDSRKRGAVAGITVFGAIFVATAIAGQLPFFRLWSVPLAAAAYAATATIQWSRADNATQVPAPQS
jgi:hypothetical protein